MLFLVVDDLDLIENLEDFIEDWSEKDTTYIKKQGKLHPFCIFKVGAGNDTMSPLDPDVDDEEYNMVVEWVNNHYSFDDGQANINKITL